jgi:Alcohol dehydrogenase GroES-associated
MKAVVYKGEKEVAVEEIEKPIIEDGTGRFAIFDPFKNGAPRCAPVSDGCTRTAVSVGPER